MDLEYLNRKQIILLALLVSFVSSVVTGIVTVSLMSKAPTQFGATVNHIVERTVQQMVPVAGPATVSTTVKTVVVKNDDLVAQSISNVRQSVIRIVDTAAKDALVARGIIIDTNGTAITDRQSIDPTLSYEAIMADGSRLPLEIQNPIATSTSFMTVVLKVSTTTPALTAAAFADTSKLALGQTVLRIGGDGEDVVGEGVISSLPSSGVFVRAEVGSTVAGSVLINMFGEVVGITTTESLAKSSTFYSIPPASKVATLSVAPASAPAHADQTNVASVAAGAANSKIKSTK